MGPLRSPSVPLWWRQANFQAFREAYRTQYEAKEDSRLLLVVGSGVSKHAAPRQMKSWAELLEELAHQHDKLYATSSNGKPPLTLRIEEILRDEANPLRFLAAGTEVRNAYTNGELWATLNNLLNGPQIRDLVSPLHGDLAHVPWRRIITTNYDCLLENAYLREGLKEPLSVAHPRQEKLRNVEQTDGRAIFKIHGDIADPESTLVLATQEYNDLYVDGTGSNRFKHTLATPIRTSELILFLGYGHADQYFNELWKRVNDGHDVEVFALMPVEGGLEEFEASVQRLAKEKIRVIGYSMDDHYAELGEFVEYLRHFPARDAEYLRRDARRRPTVVMVYCGGTIGAQQEADPLQPLRVNRQASRFSGQLDDYRDRLLNWYRDFHHAGQDLPELDVVWEILPRDYQIFSENATPEHWSLLTSTVERVVDKYIRAPRDVGQAGQPVVPPSLRAHLEDDLRQWADRGPPGADGHTVEREEKDLTVKRFIDSVSDRYVLGIVLLSGTDTLAYSAAALSLGMQHLPCPVVLTGSSQPPSSTHLPVNQRGRFFTTSDAWRNLMTTLYFLQSFGHTLTEVFVCFAETIHHGVNLRKVATGGIPYSRDPAGRRGGEHFTFRNLSYRSHYMFRMIDGMFCNNFYPRDGITFAALVGQDRDEFLDLRHVRHAGDARPGTHLGVNGFSSRVWHLKATPCAPEVDVSTLPDDRLPMMVLLEGYTSGTYPTPTHSPLFKLMEALDRRGVPTVVTAPYGLRPTGLVYETGHSGETHAPIPVLSLYSITEETALPLLCRLADEIRNDPKQLRAWSDAHPPEGAPGTRARIGLLRQTLDRFFQERPNLITEELAGLTDRDKNVGRRDRLAAEARSSEHIAHGWDPRYGIFEALKRRVRKHAGHATEHHGNTGVLLSREGFTAMVDEIVRPFQRVGAAPDGFAVLSNIGFEMGMGIVGTVGDWSRTQYPLKRFRDRPDREEALEKAAEVLRKVAEICREAGVAAVSVHKAICTSPPADTWPEGDPAECLRFAIRLERHDPMEWAHEKYAVVAFSTDDDEFFELLALRDGCSVPPERLGRMREEAFTDLLLNRWQHNLSGVDWFLLGLWKGVACGIARGLRFDSLAVEGRHLQPGHLRALRQAIRCEILFGNPHAFGLEFTYHAVGEQRMPERRPPAEERPAADRPPGGLSQGDTLPVPLDIVAPSALTEAPA